MVSQDKHLSRLFTDFLNSEKSGGIILIVCTVFSLILANSGWSDQYLGIWKTELEGHTLGHWINDGLMVLFFLLIGLELEREIYTGQLSSLRNASLPFFAAIGGMVIPAVVFLSLNYGTPAQAGAGIPMATDIAFAIGILTLLGNRVPVSLKVFLTALAVIDDLGAILVIAVFYTKSLSMINLGIALLVFFILLLLNRLKVYNLFPYLLGGAAMWYFMLHSGIHATISGVMLAFVIPFNRGGDQSPSYILQHFLHKPVAFVILPLFALANTGLVLETGWFNGLATNNSLGIIAGLVLGKPIGILLMSFLGVAVGWCTLPEGVKWKHVIGVGFLGGIGFTMSIFITLLAFDTDELVTGSKFAVLVASVLSGFAGYILLRAFSPQPAAPTVADGS